MLALRCELSTERLATRRRRRVQELAAAVFPPRTMEEARQLATLGDEATPRLAPTEAASDEEAAAAVRCLRLIGSPAADAAIDAYREVAIPAVLEELAQARHPLTLPAVIDAAADIMQWLELPSSIKARIGDAEPLRGLTNLQRLYLAGTQLADEQVAQLQEALPQLEIF